MKPLTPPDSLKLRAAEGWLELGNHVEAMVELEQIRPKSRNHPDVLELRWQILAQVKEWQGCLAVAQLLTMKAPQRATGWINLSFALHELALTKEAWENLFAVAEKFPREPTISYNLACYGAKLGRLWEAEQWLKRAFKVGEVQVLKRLALSDPDLKPLWNKIQTL